MERLSGDMGALDKIKKLTEQLESLDEEAIQKFKEDFEGFEKEYETTWLSPEELSDVSIELSEPKLCQVNEDGKWEECKDGKISLKTLTATSRQADGKITLKGKIETSIEHFPIDRMAQEITDKALSNAKSGMDRAYTDFLSIRNSDISYRQEYELLSVLYKKLGETFSDTFSLGISWRYDCNKDDWFMTIEFRW